MVEYLDDVIKQVFRDKLKDGIKIMDVGVGIGYIGVEFRKFGYINLYVL